jgi:hypothetical protein
MQQLVKMANYRQFTSKFSHAKLPTGVNIIKLFYGRNLIKNKVIRALPA